ncbi:tRNA pseudouridine(55) synthase TruB [Mesobaculum littorinae]|uniref:tRNA pseudouridine synthase B n=1 Tax=Mesobaculum littorinae TaxID=2486419 RepID=A0A438ADH6_9RHOB|nr:tRNA pseudouridine(55) synthase TruB [Mesobaculum littorinae]RVV96692.1 tRNA pseudouridine(55) synthase TruB [Mesobaculum littorinae]
MARKRKGRDISGWILLDKPAGVGSTDMVNKLRWAFQAKKAGHSGTLDPAATGLLAIALGEATKAIPHVTDALKCYRFTVRWGQATDTDDAEGTVIDTAPGRPDDAAIRAALPDFTGDIDQVPPAYSAVRVDGARAYDLARDGAAPDLAARPLFVERLDLVDRPDDDTAVFEMVCGKGGYVRSIARDLGRQLGCLGHVVTLRRLWSGPFDLNDAVSLDDIERLARTPEIDALMLPLETGLGDLPQARCDDVAALRLRNGNPAPVITSEAEYGETAWASCNGRAVAIGIYLAGELRPSRVFVT